MRVKYSNKKNRLFLWIAVALILVLGLLVLLLPLFVYIIPSVEHSGVDLYTRGTYLDYDKADVLQVMLSELSFIEQAEVTGFTYYDSVLRDTWHIRPFPDAYKLELHLGDCYASAAAELGAKCYRQDDVARDNSGENLQTFYLFENCGKDYMFAVLCEERQTVVFLLVTDTDSWLSAVGVSHRYFPIRGI